VKEAKDGGPAFPRIQEVQSTPAGGQYFGPMGMSLRDYFAAKAMASIVAATVGTFDGGESEFHAASANTAGQSYIIADAMLAAREKGTQ
jgi:hypothetical protein